MTTEIQKLFSSKTLHIDEIKLTEIERDNSDIERYSQTIEERWKEELKNNPHSYNGDVLELIDFCQNAPEVIEVKYSQIKYKDLIGLKTLEEELNRNYAHISIGAMIESQTSYLFEDRGEGELRLIGGIVEMNNGKLSLRENILKELEEELGISRDKLEINRGSLTFLTKKGTLIIVCNIKVNIDDDEIFNSYAKLTNKELKDIAFISKDNVIQELNKQGEYFPFLIDLID